MTAVLAPEADDRRLNAGRVSALAAAQAWLADGATAGLAPCADSDWADLRDQGDRPPPDLA